MDIAIFQVRRPKLDRGRGCAGPAESGPIAYYPFSYPSHPLIPHPLTPMILTLDRHLGGSEGIDGTARLVTEQSIPHPLEKGPSTPGYEL